MSTAIGSVARLGDDATGRLEPVDVGHLYVHQDDVGVPLPRNVDGIAAVAGLAADGDARLDLEDRAEAGADEAWSSAIRTEIGSSESPIETTVTVAGVPRIPLRGESTCLYLG